MKFRITIELLNDQGTADMRWEQTAPTEHMGAFVLLGRAFELAQRDTAAPFDGAISAFLRGAVIEKEDILEAFQRIDGKQ